MKTSNSIINDARRIATLFGTIFFGFAMMAEPVKIKELNLGDRVVTNAYVSKATPLEVTVLWQSGGKVFKRQELPAQLKELYPYDAGEAKRFQEEQEKERKERLEKDRIRQKEDLQEYKNTLQRQKVGIQNQMASLETDLNKINEQIDGYRRRVGRRRTAGERQDIARLEAQTRDLKLRINGMRDQVRAIDRQLAQ